MNVGKRIAGAATALLLGVATLGPSPGQAAYAAESNPHGTISLAAIDSDAGGAPEGSGSSSERKKPKHPADDGVRCADIKPGGHIDFYLPGETIVSNGRTLRCSPWGGWYVVPRSGDAGDVGSPTSGSNAP